MIIRPRYPLLDAADQEAGGVALELLGDPAERRDQLARLADQLREFVQPGGGEVVDRLVELAEQLLELTAGARQRRRGAAQLGHGAAQIAAHALDLLIDAAGQLAQIGRPAA